MYEIFPKLSEKEFWRSFPDYRCKKDLLALNWKFALQFVLIIWISYLDIIKSQMPLSVSFLCGDWRMAIVIRAMYE